MTKNNFDDEFKKRYPRWFFRRGHRHRSHWYEPFYDEHTDYNTNAKSYYDYLARFNGFIRTVVDFINRLMRRNIEVEDTNSIKFNKNGDWLDNGGCEPNHYDDVIKLNAHVKLSKLTEKRSLLNTNKKDFTINNGTVIKNDGVWSPDYIEMINEIDEEIGDLQKRISKNEGDIKNIYKEINNINSRIDSMLGINTKSLVYGRDYEIVFFNNVYTETNEMIVEYIETDTTIEFFVKGRPSSGTALKHDNANNLLMRHTSPVDEVPQSHLFKVIFKGDYAKYNNKSILTSVTNNNLWNFRPVSARASWNAILSVARRTDGYLYVWTSYSDGYNTQLDEYETNLTLNNGNINSSFIIRK